MMGFEDPSVIENFVQTTAENGMPRKVQKDRSIYLSQYNFGPLRSFRMLPKLGDFGLAQLVDGCEPLRHPIQPPLFQAPEVILGTGWSYSADIWNLGVLVSLRLVHLLPFYTNLDVLPRFGTFSRTGICFEIFAPAKGLMTVESIWGR